MYSLMLFYLVAMVTSSAYGSLPKYIQKCEGGNNDCILKNVNSILKNKYNGDEQFGLASIDPIQLGYVRLKEDSSNPVNIDISLTDAAIYGARDMKGIKIKGFGKNPDGTHSLLLKGPKLYLLGNYTVNGKILVLPVVGEGKGNLTMINPQVKIDIEGISKIKKGKLYMDVKETTLDVICDRLFYKFDNLFNGDKVLGDNINAFLNDNWLEIFNEVKSSLLLVFHKPSHAAVRAVFALTPYSDLIETYETI